MKLKSSARTAPRRSAIAGSGFAALFLAAIVSARGESPTFEGEWMRDGMPEPRFEIHGTGARNNPLRRKLTETFAGDELFVRYQVRYDAGTIDTANEDEGEFFVLWLDEAEGGEAAAHSGGVPNLGIHVSKEGENRFMARYAPGGERFGAKLVGDRDFLVVGRLWKSAPGSDAPFDHFDLWIDPEAGAEYAPDASAQSAKAIAQVRWIGFSTGAKTETEDSIEVWGVALAESWEGILGLPPKTETGGVEREASAAPVPVKTVRFASDVFPILESRCFKCHEGEDAKEDVRLDVLDEVLNRIAPRDAAESRLFQMVAEAEMPPKGKGKPLDAGELAILRAWIDEGLDWDETLLPTPVPRTDHWAFQPIRRPAVPRVVNEDWVRTAVDAFVAKKQEAMGLVPAPEAEAEVLDRRLCLDVLGLPPGETGIASPRSEIDELLGHAEYGARWARYWLDVARWAESNGHQHNRARPFAWRYRDWVVDAFNADMPFDEFVREQLAGDEMEPYRDENLVATGFLAAARYSGNELDKDIQRNDILTDIVNTTAKAFLGLTMECAQCHTHKFDPITIRDYYRMQAFFATGQPGNIVFAGNDESARALIEGRWGIFDEVHARLEEVKRKQGVPEPIYVTPETVVKAMKGEEKARFERLEGQIAMLPQSWSYYSPVSAGRGLPVAPHSMRWPLPRDPAVLEGMRTNLLIRGDVQSPGPEVEPGWPGVFGPSPQEMRKPRSALAEWMAGPDNPLTARVWVNRIWQWHFGKGLVETSEDFGTQGSDPTHPELLDWLASELIASGWSTKHIHRLILDSATYRQSSRFSAANAAIDPDNAWLWRWTPRRLEAEAVRDSILAVAGQLDPARGGPSAGEDSKRRSLYLGQRRDNFPDQQVLFDGANGIESCSRRRVSTTALQPLWLMNSAFVQEAAAKLAARAGSVEAAVRLALGRDADAGELADLERLADEFGLQSACLALLNSSEFLYIP